MKVINVIQRSEKWHDWRSKGVSASNAAVFLNGSPYKTVWRLWAEAIGKVEPDDLSRNPLVREGVLNEDRLREKVEDDYNVLLLPICAEFDGNAIFRASLDGYDEHGRPWELKWPSTKTWNEVLMLGEASPAYMLYYYQVQFQLLVTEADEGYLAFGYEGESNNIDVKMFTVKRDDDVINTIMQEGISFWNQVKNRKEPKKDPARDVYEPTGLSATEWAVMADDARDIEVQIKSLESQLEPLEAAKSKIKQSALTLMGEFAHGAHNGLEVLHFARSGSVDYKALLADVYGSVDDDVLEQYRRNSSFTTKSKIKEVQLTNEPVAIEPPPLLVGGADFF